LDIINYQIRVLLNMWLVSVTEFQNSDLPLDHHLLIVAYPRQNRCIKITIVHDTAEGRSCTPIITQTVAVLSIQCGYIIS